MKSLFVHASIIRQHICMVSTFLIEEEKLKRSFIYLLQEQFELSINLLQRGSPGCKTNATSNPH